MAKFQHPLHRIIFGSTGTHCILKAQEVSSTAPDSSILRVANCKQKGKGSGLSGVAYKTPSQRDFVLTPFRAFGEVPFFSERQMEPRRSQGTSPAVQDQAGAVGALVQVYTDLDLNAAGLLVTDGLEAVVQPAVSVVHRDYYGLEGKPYI